MLLLVGGTALILRGSSGAAIRNPWDLALLVALSLGTYFAGAIALPAFRIDVGLVLALAALVLTGPIGALAVGAIPELIRPRVERGHVRRIATVTNLASFAWAPLAGQAVLVALLTAHAQPAALALTYVLAGTAMALTNIAIVRGILGGLVDQILVAEWRTELGVLAASIALVPFAALTVCLIPAFGILALVSVAAAEACLSALVHLVTWTPRAGRLTVQEARTRYAAALALRMSLTRSERRVLMAAARSGSGRLSPWLSAAERDRVAKTLILAGLWSRSGHQSDDCFSRLQPAEMGIESRVLLVAQGWAELTASGSDQLEHHLALLTLHNSPRRYDRRVVALARDLIPDSDRQTARARVPHTRALPRRIAQLNATA